MMDGYFLFTGGKNDISHLKFWGICCLLILFVGLHLTIIIIINYFAGCYLKFTNRGKWPI